MAPSRIDGTTRRIARKLRFDQTKGEKALWRALRELKSKGVHVRRQAPVGLYIADFAMFSRRLIVEIDGDVHALPDRRTHDEIREKWLQSQGFTVLRNSSRDVDENLEGVVLDIRRKLGLD